MPSPICTCGALKEVKDTAENNEDERWRMIIGKADQAALNTFIGISFFSFFVPAVLRGIGHVATRFSWETLSNLPDGFSISFYNSYPLTLMLIVLSFRYIAIWHYKNKY
ncbi:hypothetical protein VXN63_04860 [Marinilactibacillus sp. XAAS-LB27]|uniref:hypothetical protein n=1 Tax=Marinilactibacillus sp. XAAS-LB27 TaxID=3114538 RepID=UPI002E173198|nr:hypothetical protein [Marinilactibacillus sp. XAAS-LB27]